MQSVYFSCFDAPTEGQGHCQINPVTSIIEQDIMLRRCTSINDEN